MTAPLVALANRLTAEGAVPRFVSTTLGAVEPSSGDEIEVDVSLEAAPSVLYDAMASRRGRRRQNCGPTAARSSSSRINTDTASRCWRSAMAPGCSRPAAFRETRLIPASSSRPPAQPTRDKFVAAMARHRHFVRETDPPRV